MSIYCIVHRTSHIARLLYATCIYLSLPMSIYVSLFIHIYLLNISRVWTYMYHLTVLNCVRANGNGYYSILLFTCPIVCIFLAKDGFTIQSEINDIVWSHFHCIRFSNYFLIILPNRRSICGGGAYVTVAVCAYERL